ncbi:unnamed protein product [Strongylus vulgaris]|uniref:Uncharacterized protein n=1 Tax=Strongylus vulgaris TaxID=40348 RepID=A0A3P7IWE0_STRVU|nr:unnamed protein product [Strongylus vulgaris]
MYSYYFGIYAQTLGKLAFIAGIPQIFAHYTAVVDVCPLNQWIQPENSPSMISTFVAVKKRYDHSTCPDVICHTADVCCDDNRRKV